MTESTVQFRLFPIAQNKGQIRLAGPVEQIIQVQGSVCIQLSVQFEREPGICRFELDREQGHLGK